LVQITNLVKGSCR